ncbi:MAG TPA: restriction endonuclease, partial [Pedobacter sp.]
HSNLSPHEFECLIRDILEIRDAPLKFRTYGRGKDGGIDFKCINSQEKIIGQAKLYKNDYKQLKPTLITELIKVKKQKPARYILATSVSLGKRPTEEILALFKGYLAERDIIDSEQLNKYLGQEEYRYLLRTYSKLLVPDLNMLEVFLEDSINRDIRNRTRRELAEIERGRKVFVQSKAFKQALDQLEENKVVIISGNPGVGKTTLAHMLVNYFVFENGKEIDFVYCKSLEEIDRTYKPGRKQVFLWDDFWGQKFDEVQVPASYFNSFAKLVRNFGSGDQHYLIITSREYIIKKVSSSYDKELNTIIDFNKFLLKVDAYNEEDRLRIFLNHLYFSDFEKEYFYDLQYAGRELEDIVSHENYSPRHIDYFIKFIYTDDFKAKHQDSPYVFLSSFLRYLNKPNEFWAEIFEKQSPAAQLILVILLISSDPMTTYDLKLSFLAYQAPARNVLGLQVQPLHFQQELDKLEELFIRTEELYEFEDILIYFQSPGIKDFLLEYLRQRMDQYAKVLIPNALFFNQLSFVFTTLGEKDKIEDYDSDTVLYGTKILLGTQAQHMLKHKVFSDLNQLKYSIDRGKGFTRGLDRYDSIGDIRYWNLWQLSRWFPLDK